MNFYLLGLGIATGVGLGSIYVLVGISYTLVLSASGIFNFTQGAILTVGAILTYVLGDRNGIPALETAGIIVGVGALIGLVTEFLTARPFLGRSASLTEEALVSTLGMGLTITALAAIFFGDDTHPVASYVQPDVVTIASIPVRTIYIVMFGIALVVSLAFDRVVARTGIGAEFRAIVTDREGAVALGINPQRILLTSFVLAGVLAGLAGFLIAPVTSASAFIGNNITLMAFAGMAVGGYGSFRGTVIGGMVIGLVAGIAPVYLEPSLTGPVIFGLIIVILVLRPFGVFGTAGQYGAASLREV